MLGPILFCFNAPKKPEAQKPTRECFSAHLWPLEAGSRRFLSLLCSVCVFERPKNLCEHASRPTYGRKKHARVGVSAYYFLFLSLKRPKTLRERRFWGLLFSVCVSERPKNLYEHASRPTYGGWKHALIGFGLILVLCSPPKAQTPTRACFSAHVWPLEAGSRRFFGLLFSLLVFKRPKTLRERVSRTIYGC